MICIAGKNDIATHTLEFVVQLVGATEVRVLPNRDDVGEANWQHSLRATASHLNVVVITLAEAYELDDLHFFSVEFDRIVVPKRFKPNAQLYNIHFSLLPQYKGVYTAAWPLLNGEKETGVTLHRIEAGIDTGPILDQRPVPILPTYTAREVYCACMAAGLELLREHIPSLLVEPKPGVQQSAEQSTYYGPTSLDYANLVINLRQTAYQVANAVRAFCFQEYQLPTVGRHRVRNPVITMQVSQAQPGIVVEETATMLVVSTIDFDLRLEKDFSADLVAAVGAGNAEQVVSLLPAVPYLEFRTRQGWTPLMMAAYAGDLATAAALLGGGADINAANKKGTTVLMYAKTAAALTNQFDLLHHLLAHGVDPKRTDQAGKTALDYARLEGNEAVILLLSGY